MASSSSSYVPKGQQGLLLRTPLTFGFAPTTYDPASSSPAKVSEWGCAFHFHCEDFQIDRYVCIVYFNKPIVIIFTNQQSPQTISGRLRLKVYILLVHIGG